MKSDNVTISEKFQGEEPEIFAVDHAADFDSYAERLQEAQLDYQEACEAFLKTNPGTDAIMQAAELAEQAAKALYSRVTVIFLMPEASAEDRAYAREILDRLTKDSCIRERTCSRLYRKVREVHSEDTVKIGSLLKEKQKRMKFLDRCMATQAHYLKDRKSTKDAAAEQQEKMIRSSYKAHRMRQQIPHGSRFCPPQIFPHDPIPEGRPVPYPPEPFIRFTELEPEDLVFNAEQSNFEIRPDYISEDGLMDAQSVTWDYEKHKVAMKYRGEEPVIWDFRQYIGLREVPRPEDWDVQYKRRLRVQWEADEQQGILHRRNQE